MIRNVQIFVVFIMFFVPCSVSFAAIEIHPQVMLSEEYDDNIYLSDNNEEEDWITTFRPGISLVYTSRSVDASADYSLLYRFYKNNNDENEDDLEDIQRASASMTLFSGRPFTVRASQTITREVLDDRDASADYDDLEDRSTVYHTTVTPEYRYQVTPTFSVTTAYTYDFIAYVEPEGNDTQEHTGTLTLTKTLSSRADVFLRYAYRILNAKDSAEEFDRQDYYAGFTYQIGSRTSVSAEGGFSDVEYDSGYTTDSTNWSVDLSYAVSEALTYSLIYERDFVVTALDGLTESQEVSFNVAYQRESMSADGRIYWRNSDYIRESREDDIYG